MVGEGALLPLHLGSAGRVLTGEVGRHGWVETVEEREPGVASVSAPIVAAAAGVLAAVSVGGPIERLTRQPGKRFGADVVAASGRHRRIAVAGRSGRIRANRPRARPVLHRHRTADRVQVRHGPPTLVQ